MLLISGLITKITLYSSSFSTEKLTAVTEITNV